MPDFDAAAEVQRAFAVRARIAGDDVADVGDQCRLRQVAPPVDVGVMLAVDVRAGGEVAGSRGGSVDDDGELGRILDLERPKRTKAGADYRAHVGFGGGLQRREQGGQFGRLDFVQHVIAAQYESDEACSALVDEGLDGFLRGNAEQAAQIVYGAHARRRHSGERCAGRAAGSRRRHPFGEFDIRGVV